MYRGLRIVPHDTRIDFMRFHKAAFALSVAMVVASILLIAFKGLNFGVDLAGGIRVQVKSTTGPVDLATLRAELGGLGLGEIALQEFGGPDQVQIRVQNPEVTPDHLAEAKKILEEARPPIPADEIERRLPETAAELAQQRTIALIEGHFREGYASPSTTFVGPKIGREYVQDAILAAVLAMLGIMAYVWFRYEWQFAINCIVALFHDCVTMVGLFALLDLQFDLTIVAAVLTIAGFSVNDTVVIYDRIREELRRYKKMPLRELLNMSINRTLSRTTMTSGLAFLAVLAIYLFGGATLQGFAIAMLWGIVIGTYSTIFVASPMLVYMNLRRESVTGDKPADAEAASKGA
jgi:preprotein translocase SecF subunit